MGVTNITRKAVLAAIKEHDRDGEDAFLRKYGFRRAHSYWLEHGNHLYSSKAIVGAAHGYIGPNSQPLAANQFTGGKATVETKLKALGFEFRVDRDGEQTSEGLIEGEIYTRDRLRAEFGITDATMDNGIFQPSETNSVWLFVTEETSDPAKKYKNRLRGNTLEMQGQKKGRTDKLIIDHAVLGLELLAFYRRSRHEYPGSGFRYLGAFGYTSHSGGGPTDFVLTRKLETDPEPGGDGAPPFDPTSVEDARKRIKRSIAERRGQRSFRNGLLAAYDNRCAISGCSVFDALEAAHIYPYRGDETNHISNGLLLRADLHTLFDCGLISVKPTSKKTIVVAKKLIGTEYEAFAGVELRRPRSKATEPSREALELHYKERTR